MSRKVTPGLILILILLVGTACSATAAAQVEESPMDSRPAAPADPSGDFRADLAEHVGSTGRPQMIEFFAYWCTVCNAMKPTVHDLEAEYWGEIDFVYLDIDDQANSDMLAEYGFTAQPLYVLVEPDGTEVTRWFGYNSADDFRSEFDTLLAN